MDGSCYIHAKWCYLLWDLLLTDLITVPPPPKTVHPKYKGVLVLSLLYNRYSVLLVMFLCCPHHHRICVPSSSALSGVTNLCHVVLPFSLIIPSGKL